MRIFKLSPQKKIYLLSFFRDEPVWELYSQDGREKVDRPVKNPGIPILAIIPDRFFFFYIPRAIQGKNLRHSREAARLQLGHLFPSPGPGEDMGVLNTGNEILGFFQKADFGHFLEKYKDQLAMAGSVTTPFLLGRALMHAENISSWYTRNPGDPVVLVRKDRLDYFSGDDRELEKRLGNHKSDEKPVLLEFRDLVSRLTNMVIPWSRFRLSLPEIEVRRGETRFLAGVAAVILVAGLLFCFGEIFKLFSARSYKNDWEKALESLYASALGPDFGSDPYGLLLYRASQSRSEDQNGLDILSLLGILSGSAPDSLVVESLSLGIDSGVIRAFVGSYDEMENFINQLRRNNKYTFTLDQADSADGRVNLTIRVAY